VEYHEGIRVMPKPVEETAETKATVKTNNLKKTENLTVPPPVEEEAEVNTGYYTEAEVMPQPVGGMSAIYKRLVYPYDAKKNEIEGIVKAQLFIDEWGDVVLLEILEGPGYGLEESVRTTLYYTKFSPGLIKGKPVKMKLIMPIEFKLPKEEE
jgi:protein TonB